MLERFMPCLHRSAWCLDDAAIDDDLLQDEAHDVVMGAHHDLLETGEDAGSDPFVAAARIVVAQHPESAMPS